MTTTSEGSVAEHLIVSAIVSWTVPPIPSFASRVREMLSGMYGEILDHDDVDSITMVAHELLENLFKYSVDGTSRFEIELSRRGDKSWIRIETQNTGSAEGAAEMAHLVRRLGQVEDPLALYDELVATSPSRKGSGLGLARIRAEAAMNIALVVDGRQLTLTAEREVSLPENRS